MTLKRSIFFLQLQRYAATCIKNGSFDKNFVIVDKINLNFCFYLRLWKVNWQFWKSERFPEAPTCAVCLRDSGREISPHSKYLGFLNVLAKIEGFRATTDVPLRFSSDIFRGRGWVASKWEILNSVTNFWEN